MEFSGKALVLRQGPFREADVWLKLFSPGHGVFTAFAFGGMKSRRRFPGCLEPLSLALFTVGQSRDSRYLVLEEGTLVNGFSALKADPGRLGMAVNSLRFVEAVSSGPVESRRLFDLLLAYLEVLESGRGDESMPVFFRARVAFEEGYQPDLTSCAGCKRPLSAFDRPRFFVHKGRVLCPDCPPGEEAGDEPGQGMPVSPGALMALDWVRTHDPEQWPELSLTPETDRQCRRLVERFVAFHLGLSLENNGYKTI